MEAYVDDLVIKSNSEEDLLKDVEETFKNLRRINMKLNPTKCLFGVEEGISLGHLITKQMIKANPDKVEAVKKMTSPKTKKEVQRLNGRLGALHRFMSKLAVKSLPFFKTLKGCITKATSSGVPNQKKPSRRSRNIWLACLPLQYRVHENASCSTCQ
jgi:hypothetical protein